MNADLPPLVPPGLDPSNSPAATRPISGLFDTLDALLRRPWDIWYHLGRPRSASLISALLLVAFFGTGLYGLVVGSFSGGMQWWAAPVKLAVGVVLGGAICLPSLYVFACLAGATIKLTEVVGLVAGLLALLGILLVSFAPVAWVFSQSTNSVVAMGALHLMFWFIATAFGARFVHRGLARLGARSSVVTAVWSALLVLVMLQMMTALRPLVGTAEKFLPDEKQFFLQHWGISIDQLPRN